MRHDEYKSNSHSLLAFVLEVDFRSSKLNQRIKFLSRVKILPHTPLNSKLEVRANKQDGQH